MNERAIFDAALEIQDPDQRRAFLHKACGDSSELRARIEALLAAHDGVGSFLDIPAIEQVQPGTSSPIDRTTDFSPQTRGEEDGDEDDIRRIVLSFLQPSQKPGSIGTLGHYEILKILGQGGFGVVLKAFDEKLHRHVAIKMMNPRLAATSPPRKRFLREARAAAAIRHENIVQVHSVEEQPLPYLVMEYISGDTLQQKLDAKGPLSTTEVLHLGRQIAAGLAAAHASGLIHRDIKPGNILIEEGAEQKVKITDFGMARAADDASMTRSGVVSGTPMYMAPEQAQGQSLDHRADLFSLGSVFYQMACGRPPFRAATAIAVLRRVVEDTPRPLREILPEIPDWLVAIVDKLHAKKPEERFQSAKEVADLLGLCQSKLQAGVTPTAVALGLKPAPVEPVAKAEPKRKKFPVAGVAAGVLLMVAVMAAGLFFLNKNKNEGNVAVGPPATPVVTVPATAADTDRKAAAIFNGKDLTGWTGMKQYWRVEDGAIIGMHSGNLSHHTFLCTEKIYGDFELSFKIRLTNGIGNSGVQIRSKLIDAQKFSVAGPQADAGVINNRNYWGGIWGQDFGGLIAESNADKVKAVVKKDDFNDYSIKVVGNRFSIKINGTTMVDDVFEKSPDGKHAFATEGIIALQLHPGPAMEVTFKDFYFKELGPVSVALDRRPQFRMGGEWRIEGNELVQTSPNNAAILFGDRNWTDYDFEVELNSQGKTKDGHGAGVLYRATDLANFFDLQIGGWSATVSEVTFLKNQKWGRIPGTFLRVPHEHDRWYKAKVEVRGAKIRCSVDGKDLFVFEDADHPKGMVGLSNGNSPVRWRNLKVTAPDGRALWEGFPDFGDPIPAGPLPLTHKNSLGMEFVKVPKGTGWLGGGAGKQGETKVVIEQDFYLGKYEVTQEEWEKITGSIPSHFSRDKKAIHAALKQISHEELTRFPVEQVSWNDCQLFIEELNKKEAGTGWIYRLPTAAEWEYACRGGPIEKRESAFDFYFAQPTNTLLTNQANFNYSLNRTSKVGSYEGNRLGLFDMHGNVHEWCSDEFKLDNGTVCRVLKGGSWDHHANDSQASHRYTDPPTHRDGHLGLRLARVPVSPAVAVPLATDPDRKAAEWVLSVGGTVRVNSEEKDIKTIDALPKPPFVLTMVGINSSKREYLTDETLSQFKNCAGLKALHVNGSLITDSRLEHFQNCKNLTDLRLTFTRVTDAGLAYFKGCKLTTLDLGGSVEVTDAGMTNFNNCKNLIELNLYGVPASDVGLANFKDCKQLTSLRLEGTQVTDNGLAYFKDCKDLCKLELNHTRITDAGLIHFKDTRFLDFIELAGTQVTGSGLVHFNNCKTPYVINLMGTPIGDEGLKELAKVTGLRTVILKRTNVTAAGIDGLMKALPKLVIEWDGGLIDPKKAAADPDRNAAEWVLANGGKVQIAPGGDVISLDKLPTHKFTTGLISFDGLKFKEESELKCLVQLAHLEQVFLGPAPITGLGLGYFATCPEIVVLALDSTAVRDGDLGVLKNLKKLQNLTLHNTRTTDAAIEHILECPRLTQLDLSLTGITDAGLRKLEVLKGLQFIQVYQTKVSAEGVKKFAAALPGCKIRWDGGVIEPK